MCLSTLKLSAHDFITIPDNFISFNNPKEEALFDKLDELSKEELIYLTFLADDPTISELNYNKAINNLNAIAKSFEHKKYSKNTAAKNALKIYNDLVKKHCRKNADVATITEFHQTGLTSLYSQMTIAAYVFDRLNIDVDFLTNTDGYWIRLLPKEDDIRVRIGYFVQNEKYSMARINNDIELFIESSINDRFFTSDSVNTNMIARKGNVWKKLAQLHYTQTSIAQVEKNDNENAIQSCLKAHRLIPTSYTELRVFSLLLIDLNYPKEDDLDHKSDKYVFMVNHFNTFVERNLVALCEQIMIDEFQRESKIDESLKLINGFIEIVTDEEVLNELNFLVHALMANHFVYQNTSRNFIRHYLRAREIYPEHIRIKSIAFEGVNNYLVKERFNMSYDTLKVLVELIPEAKNDSRFCNLELGCMTNQSAYLIDKSYFTAFRKTYADLIKLECDNPNSSLSDGIDLIFGEYSAYYVRKNQMSTARTILQDGIALKSRLGLSSTELRDRYDLIKGVKSLY
jgi:hypothetical protein